VGMAAITTGVLGVDGSVFEALMTGRLKGSQVGNASLLLL